jgi:hypothetical protein
MRADLVSNGVMRRLGLTHLSKTQAMKELANWGMAAR